MADFILNENGATKDMDDFTIGYIEAAFFTEELDDFSVGDIHPESLKIIIKECKDFQEKYQEDLDKALDIGRIDGYDDRRAGNDFWYSRNGHGSGFWDRDLGEIGDKLHTNCAYQERYLYEEDNIIYYGD